MTKKNNSVTAIIQARMGSSRLPGKVMMDIAGRPMLWHVIDRVHRSTKIDNIVIATTALTEDDRIREFAEKLTLPCYRGQVDDVLGRYCGAAVESKAGTIVRICSDQPLIDPEIIDKIIAAYTDSGADYASNTLKETYPLGVYAEVFSYNTLKKAKDEATKDYEREHVTPYIYRHPEIFRLKSVEAEGGLRRPDLRLTVDTEEDLKLVREIYHNLYRGDKVFSLGKVIELLDKHPEIAAVNAHIKQKRLGE